MLVRLSYEDGSDDLSVLEHLGPLGASPPLHLHRAEDEVFHILHGELRFRLDDRERRAGPGEILLAPRGVPHTYRVESPSARWLTVTCRTDFERFVRSFARPAQHDGLPEPSDPPSPEQVRALEEACQRYNIQIVGPPLQ